MSRTFTKIKALNIETGKVLVQGEDAEKVIKASNDLGVGYILDFE